MALVNTEEFQTIGIIMGAVFFIGIIYFVMVVKDKSAHRGGRRKRPRQMKKKRR